MAGLDIARIAKLARKIRRSRDCKSALEFVDEYAPQADALVSSFFSPKAEVQFRVKRRLGWRGGSQDSPLDYRKRDSWANQYYADEIELLEARHPRRVQRLWEATQPLLAQRYGQQFASRDEFALLHILDRSRQELHESLQELSEFRSVVEDFTRCQGVGLEEATAFLVRYGLQPVSLYAVAETAGLLLDANNPHALFAAALRLEEKHKNKALKSGVSGFSVIEGGFFTRGCQKLEKYEPNVRLEFLVEQAADIVRSRTGTLSFDRAREYFSPLATDGTNWRLFEGEREPRVMAAQVLKHHYANRTTEAQATVSLLVRELLAYWKATAADYELVFDTHGIGFETQRAIEKLHLLKYGSVRGREMEEGRLPTVLDMLVHDGYLTEADISPPLPQHKTRRDFLALPPSEQREQLELLPTIEPKALAAGERAGYSAYPLVKRGTWSLAHVAHEVGEDVLYQGRALKILGRRSAYPSGEEYYSAYTVIMPSQESNATLVDGRPSSIRSLNVSTLVHSLADELANNYSDLLPADSLVLVPDLPVKTLQEGYLQDMLALNALSCRWLRASEHAMLLQQIPEWANTQVHWNLGASSRLEFKTHELFDGMALMLIPTRGNRDEMFAAGLLLVDYLGRNAIPFKVQQHIGAYGRQRRDEKLAAREFAEAHLDEVVQALQGNGIINVLSFAYIDSSINVDRFGPSWTPCDECGKHYIDGSALPKGGEWWRDSVYFKDLHSLREHPRTFADKFESLKKIYGLVMKGKDFDPAFVAKPEIIVPFAKFMKAMRFSVAAQNAAYEFWQEAGGALIDVEEEELEENPELAALRENETRFWRAEHRREAVEKGRALKLHRAYIAAGGASALSGENAVLQFWRQQATLHTVYLMYGPKLLPATTHKELLSPLQIHWSQYGI